MANEQETIADIVREMKEFRGISCGHWIEAMPCAQFDEWLARIELAYKNEIGWLTAAYNNAVTAYVSNAMKVKRLRRALKPVLDCHLCAGGQQVVSDALCAIREAKEIMKGETK